MKHLKLFETSTQYDAFKNSDAFVLPNVSYITNQQQVQYHAIKNEKPIVLKAKYNATPDNLVAFNGASNIKSLKVNGTSIKIEPIKNENTTFDVLGENISLDMETGDATFPESYLIKSPVSSWSFKAKDPNYVINENTYICMLGMYDGGAYVEPTPIMAVMDNTFTTTDGVTLEIVDEFLTELNNEYIQYGEYIGFTLVDIDMNSGTCVFIDTEHQTNVTTGGLPTYSFDSEGLYDVEIELADPVMNMQFAETPLISIEIGDGITSIGDGAFDSCSGLTSITISDSVTTIGDNAFYNCSGLTSITIPDSVTTIGDNAFYNCSGLTSIVIPDSVTEIGRDVFEQCTGLTSITIPDSVTSIGSYAFRGCSGLTSIIIPDSVTSIGSYAFAYCSGLSEITCNAITTPTVDYNTFYRVKEGGILKVLGGSDYSTWMSTDYTYLGYYNWKNEYMIELPEDFEDSIIMTSVSNPIAMEICYNQGWAASPDQMLYTESKKVADIGTAFAESNIMSFNELQYFDNLRKISRNAFYNCSSLTSIVIPDSVTTIGEDAFKSCTSLPVEDNLRYADTYLVEAVDKSLSTYTIKEGTKWIGTRAFYYCKSLTSIVIPDSVTSIGEEAFYICSGLTSIVIPDSVTSIGERAFQNCKGLTGELVIPDSVTTIGEGAFSHCKDLTSIVVSEKNTIYDSRENCNCIIETATNTLVKGCHNSFIPDSVTTIGNRAFAGCTGLTSIIIPDSVISIEKRAFDDCTELTSIHIGSGVTSIGYLAFGECRSLTSIVIPDSVTSIGDAVFYYCRGLSEITCNAVIAPTIDSGTFTGIKSYGVLKVPAGSDYSSWMSTDNYYLGYYNWTIQYI